MRRYSLLISVVTIMTIFSSCAAHVDSGENPLLMEWDTPFGVPPFEQIKAKHFLPALDTAFVAHTAQIEAITSSEEPATFESVILAYDNSGVLLSEIYTI
ncbi:MAG: peptidase M3, partial [Rikenellaceae bacterium]